MGPPPFEAPGEGEDRGNRRHSSTHAAEDQLEQNAGNKEVKWKKAAEESGIYRKRCDFKKKL